MLRYIRHAVRETAAKVELKLQKKIGKLQRRNGELERLHTSTVSARVFVVVVAIAIVVVVVIVSIVSVVCFCV